MPSAAALSARLSMSEPTISILWLSTSVQFSISQMAIEYGSSPVEHGIDQMRIGSPGFLRCRRSPKQIGRHAAKLMVLTIEVGLVHGEGIDQMFDLVIGVGRAAAKNTTGTTPTASRRCDPRDGDR